MQDKILVMGEGPKDCKIALIGEAPGSQEIYQRRPFVGPAGHLLNTLLSSAGIIRSDCYVTNVIKEQPPKTSKKANDISVFVDLSKKVPIETEQYKEYCRSLKEELINISANILIAFGNVPLYALTGMYPPAITKRRGSIYQSTLVEGKKVIACIHPAACIHQGRQGGMYIWQYFILHDLKRAKEESATREMPLDPYHYIIKPIYSQSKALLETILQTKPIVAFDIEVVNLEVSCISFAFDSTAVSIPFTHNYHSYFTLEEEMNIWELIARVLGDPAIKKIGQNLVFDTQFLFRKYGIITNNIDDTMIGQAILIPDFPKGLDFITSVHTKIPYYKDEGKKYFKIGGSDEDFWLYNAKDSRVCIEAFPKIFSELRSLENEEAYERQKKLVPVLVYMSERGMRTNREGLVQASDAAKERIGELTNKLKRMCGYDINPDSAPQVIDYFYNKKGLKPYTNRKTGKPTTDVDALKRLSRKGIAEASIMLELRRLAKLKSSYFDVKLDDDDRIRCSFNPVGKSDEGGLDEKYKRGIPTGRISSGKTIWETGMNFQTMTDEFKKYILFDEGYIGYSIDLGQAENRIVAYISPDSQLINDFESGIDVHVSTAAMVSGLTYDEVMGQYKNKVNCILGNGDKPWRFWGKKTNHAVNYDEGYKTFALKNEMLESDARRILAAIKFNRPSINYYHNWIQEELRRGRRLTNLMDRTRLFMERWGPDLFRQAYAQIPQSTVADKVNEHGLIEVYYDQHKYHHVELLNQIHDSIVFQIPISIGWESHAKILLAIREKLETPLSWRGREFVIPADLSIGSNMKDMEDVEWVSDQTQMARRLQTVWSRTKLS